MFGMMPLLPVCNNELEYCWLLRGKVRFERDLQSPPDQKPGTFTDEIGRFRYPRHADRTKRSPKGSGQIVHLLNGQQTRGHQNLTDLASKKNIRIERKYGRALGRNQSRSLLKVNRDAFG